MMYQVVINAFIFSMVCRGEITEIFSLKSVGECIELVKSDHQKIMIIWDIDETIFTTTGMYGGDAWFYHEVQKKIEAGHPIKRAVDLTLPDYYHAQHKIVVQPTEFDVVNFISQLQDDGHLVCALTARGPFIAIKTQEHLESLGINFSRSCSIANMNDPHFFCWKGVLYAGPHEKGETLVAFLRYVEHETDISLPTCYVFIDDKKRHLESVEKALLNAYPHSAFYGFRYAGSDHSSLSFCPVRAEKEKLFMGSSV